MDHIKELAEMILLTEELISKQNGFATSPTPYFKREMIRVQGRIESKIQTLRAAGINPRKPTADQGGMFK